MSVIKAQEYLYHCWAGLTLVGRNEEGDLEWVGENKNWIALEWLLDGVYEDHEDKGKEAISSYLN